MHIPTDMLLVLLEFVQMVGDEFCCYIASILQNMINYIHFLPVKVVADATVTTTCTV